MRFCLSERCFILILLFAAPVWLAGQPAKATPESAVLVADSKTDLHLDPGVKYSLSIRIPSGKVVSIAFQQLQASVQVRWSPEGIAPDDPKILPRINRSGRLSSIVFHAAGFAPGPGDSAGTMLVENKGKRAAEVRVLLGSLRPATAADAAIAQAEQDVAAAIELAANRTPANAAKSLEHLQAAEKAWRQAGDSVELARVLALEAYTLAFPLNDGASALLKAPELTALASQIASADAAEAGNALKTAGFVYAKQANYAGALEQYNAALPLFERTGDTYNRVVVLENRAKIERIQGSNAQALADVQAAIPLAEQDDDSRGELALEVERGAIATASGEIGLAYEANLRALSIAPKANDDYLEALAWSDLGVACTELHDFEQAGRALDRADAIWKRTSNAYGQIQTQEDRAELRLAQNDLPGARTAFALGADQAAKGALDREHAYFLRGLAVTEMRSGKIPEAKQHLDQAIEQAERIHLGDQLSALYSSAGDLSAAQHQWSDAEAQWRRANEQAEQRGDSLDRAIALGGLARAALALGHLDAASDRCRQAMSALESVRAGIGDSDLRLSFYASRHDLYDLCVQTELQRGHAEAAFDAMERGRARSLMDQAAASGVQSEISRNLLDRIQANQEKLSAARNALSANRRRSSNPALGQAAALLKERDVLRTEAIQSGLSEELATAAVPFTQQETIRQLDAHTALLAYWLGQEKSCVWLVTQDGAKEYPLPRSSALALRSRQYASVLLAPLLLDANASAAEQARALAAARASATVQGRALRQILFPAAIPAGIRRLLIVKDGPLLALSFASLPSTNGRYFGERYELATEPSAAFAFRPASRPVEFSQLRAVVFADPSTSPEDRLASREVSPVELIAASPTTPSRVGSVNRLPFSREEAAQIGRAFGVRNTRILSGPEASRSTALTLDWASYTVAHFATHAVFRDSHLELSGLVLAAGDASQGNSGEARTSILSVSDLLRMKVPLRLAVLNACNSGIGRFVPGEGKLALDNAFLAAGTATVIGTLWPVDDEAGSVFMAGFYSFLAANHSPALSLRLAQQKMAASRQWNAPYYWGAYFLSGNWRPLSD